MASIVGTNCLCGCINRSARFGDGHAVPKRVTSNRKWFAAGTTFLLGTERNHVGDRIDRHGVRRVDGRIPGSNVDGKCVLRAGGVGVEASVCRECGLGLIDLRSQISDLRSKILAYILRSEIYFAAMTT